jgi:hypothetical protein
VNAIENDPKEIDDAPHSGAATSVDERHMEQVKSVLERTCCILWQLLQKSESLQQAFAVSCPAAWGNKQVVKGGLHTC